MDNNSINRKLSRLKWTIKNKIHISDYNRKIYNKKKKKMILIRGPSGSGKTYYAQNVYKDYIYVSIDNYFNENKKKYNLNLIKIADDYCIKEIKKYNKIDVNIVVANPFTYISEIQKYLNLFGKKYDITIIRMATQFQTIHDVSDLEIEDYYKKYEIYQGEKYIKFINNEMKEYTKTSIKFDLN